MTIELVDYSRGGFPGSSALKANGKVGVIRYVVGDLSPVERGITAQEYQELTAGGIQVAAVWEGTTGRMRAGFAAGQVDARDAEAHIAAAGMPALMPIYFAFDDDATPEDQTAIDDYLRGVASVIKLERTGLYGGYWPLRRASANGTAKWFWQTTAWSGGNIFAGNHLYQYGYNLWINSVNCDANQAFQDNYGQASLFLTPPKPTPAPTPKPKPLTSPATVPGIKLPSGLTVKMLERLYTGNAENKIKIADETISFYVNGQVSRAWLKRGLSSIPKGKDWHEGVFPQIKDRVLRGTNGKDGTDWVFVTGSSIHVDPHGKIA